MRRLKHVNKITLFHISMMAGMVFWSAILYGLFSWAAIAEREHVMETIKLKAESLTNHAGAGAS